MKVDETPGDAWLDEVRGFREDVGEPSAEQVAAARRSLGIDVTAKPRRLRPVAVVAAVAGLGMAAAAVGFVVVDRTEQAEGSAASSSVGSSTSSAASRGAAGGVEVLADGRVQITVPDTPGQPELAALNAKLEQSKVPVALTANAQAMQEGDWQTLWATQVGHPGEGDTLSPGTPDFADRLIDVEYADSSKAEIDTITLPETPTHYVTFDFYDPDAWNADATPNMNPYPSDSPLHCLAMHDEPLSEVAAKLGETDLDVTYSLPVIPDEGEEYWTHLTQAEAEADTEHKVSEVIQRSSGEIEVYFTTKDDRDFLTAEERDAFEEACPNPR